MSRPPRPPYACPRSIRLRFRIAFLPLLSAFLLLSTRHYRTNHSMNRARHIFVPHRGPPRIIFPASIFVLLCASIRSFRSAGSHPPTTHHPSTTKITITTGDLSANTGTRRCRYLLTTWEHVYMGWI
ncbi:hypothetical protein B0H17DRAFT_1033047 [Mycena rosella]|uniref:Uncharacterized protein n=1 Tax=Mycena rosella TaxID=1033263 RepID=A0AAD7GXX3_MYCRO|nr:hypothetical protein B0H17DRAFT_1033047 [Mycena rosella]